MSNILSEEYPRQQTFTSVGIQFVNRLNDYFGGNWRIVAHEVRSSSDQEQEEYVELSNGRQIKVILSRDPESFEITAQASYVFNEGYLKHITCQDKDYLVKLLAKEGQELPELEDWKTCRALYQLATERFVQLMSIPGVTEPLTVEQKEEEKHLSFLIPKLMIATGQATEANFQSESVQIWGC